ncbi:MAG: hydroxypyruvate isomerase family protein [Hyphomicrobiaceae bacterium]
MHFAANLSMMFQEHPFLDRFAAAKCAGFDQVEYLFPYEWRGEDIAKRLDDHSLQQVLFNLDPGDWDAGERGLACLPGREEEFQATVSQALKYAEVLSCRRLHAMAGIQPPDIDPEVCRATYIENISLAAKRCREAGVSLLIEPINPTDIPGFFLNDFAMAMNVIDEIGAEVGAQYAPKLLFDIYHCAKIHSNVTDWIETCREVTAHYQIAGIPDRHEPDEGTLALSDMLAAVEKVHPELTIGCEYRPKGETTAGLGWIERARQ